VTLDDAVARLDEPLRGAPMDALDAWRVVRGAARTSRRQSQRALAMQSHASLALDALRRGVEEAEAVGEEPTR